MQESEGVTFLIMVVLLVTVLFLRLLQSNMDGALFALVVIGGIFFYIGNNLPILSSYLDGGSAFAVVAGSILAGTGGVPLSQ